MLLLSKGRTCYFGPTVKVGNHFGNIGYPIPTNVNPAEFILDIVSTDFSRDEEDDIYGDKDNSSQPARTATERLEYILKSWQESEQARVEDTQAARPPDGQDAEAKMKLLVEDAASSRPTWYRIVFALLHRSFIKSNRDVVAYGIRIAMYLGLAIMMGTVWLRLHVSQEYIQPFINAIVSLTHVHMNKRITNIHTSFSVRLLCPLWRSPMYQLTSRIAQHSSKNVPMDYMERLPSSFRIS